VGFVDGHHTGRVTLTTLPENVNTLAFLGRVCLSATPGQEPEIELALV
jgi:hypothetical protein